MKVCLRCHYASPDARRYCVKCHYTFTPSTTGVVHARTTVGAAFVAPDAVSEKLVARIVEFLGVPDERARNLAQVLVLEFEITERK